MRALPKRGGGQGGSKWLREEDDVGWTERIGRENNCPIFQGGKSGDHDRDTDLRRDHRNSGGENSKTLSLRLSQGGRSDLSGPSSIAQLLIKENDGLDLDERKRKRIGPISHITMDTDDRLPKGDRSIDLNQHKEAVFSDSDYAVSHENVLATLAVQASQPL